MLKAGQAGGSGLKRIAQAAAAGGLFKLCESGLGLWSATAQGGLRLGRGLAYFGSNLSPALLSVGYIVGLNIAMLIFLGGVANWLIAIPICAAAQEWPVENGAALSAVDWAHKLWSTQTRYLGVGGMLVGGLWSVLKMRGSILGGVRSGLGAWRRARGDGAALPRTERDLPMRWVLVLTAASVVPLFAIYQVFVQRISVTLPMAGVMLVAGFLFSAVAAYMAGVVGSSNNPISGVTIATVSVSALLLVLLMGRDAPNGPAAAIIIGAVVCCAAAIAGDNMQDLKAGHLVGATPWKQQVMQIVGTLSAALVVAPVMSLLLHAYGLKGHVSAKAGALAAPQAGLMASVAKGVFAGGLPWGFVVGGMAVAVGVIALDEWLARRGSSFRTPVLAVAIGFYLPLELAVPIFAGGLIHEAVRRRRPAGNGSPDSSASSGHGLLLAAGLITGEALMGILLAVPAAIPGGAGLLGLAGEPWGAWPGLALLGGIAWWLYRSARAEPAATPAQK